MHIEAFFDERTSTISYLVWDSESRDAVIVDPVLDYDPVGSKVWSDSVDALARRISEQGLRLHLILETHAHADHLSGAQALKARFPGSRLAISKRIVEVQAIFKQVFDLPEEFAADGSQFDVLFGEDEELRAGTIEVRPLATPGHTPACTTFIVGDAAFTGDALFMPDVGTGRCDFPGGSADDLYDSVAQGIYSLPDQTRVFVGHDYPPEGRDVAWETTVGEQKLRNIQLNQGTSRDEYLELRQRRDSSLPAPRLLYQSVQVNIDAGRLPSASTSGTRYLKVPVNVVGDSVGDGAGSP